MGDSLKYFKAYDLRIILRVIRVIRFFPEYINSNYYEYIRNIQRNKNNYFFRRFLMFHISWKYLVGNNGAFLMNI